MATLHSARCTSCGIEGEGLPVGRVMQPSLFQGAPAWCPGCRALVTTKIVTPYRELSELGREASGLPASELAPDGPSVLALALRLRARPNCPRCSRRVHHLRFDNPAPTGLDPITVRCPSCAKDTLEVRISGFGD